MIENKIQNILSLMIIICLFKDFFQKDLYSYNPGFKWKTIIVGFSRIFTTIKEYFSVISFVFEEYFLRNFTAIIDEFCGIFLLGSIYQLYVDFFRGSIIQPHGELKEYFSNFKSPTSHGLKKYFSRISRTNKRD